MTATPSEKAVGTPYGLDPDLPPTNTAPERETTPVTAQADAPVTETEYLKALEAAVLDAEWWLADPQVAQRKDQRGERKRAVYRAADLVRAHNRKGA